MFNCRVNSQESETTVDDMITNLENNQQALKTWSEGLEALAEKGINQGLLEKLKKAGPDSAGIVKNMVNASDEELKKLNDVFAKGTGAATEALLTELGLPKVINSGADMVDDISEGIENNANLEKSTVQLVKTTLTSVSAEINNGGFVKIGVQIAEGMAQGVRDGTSVLVQAVKDMAETAVSTAKKSLDIHSPSRIFRNKVGLMVALGFSEGIEDGLSNISQSALKMSDKATDGLDLGFMKSMQKLADKMGDITPIFASGQAIPAHTPFANVISNSDNHATAYTQNIKLTGNDMSDAQKIRLLQIQSRRMLRLGV